MEICGDGIDNDCDGVADGGFDSDGDGVGDLCDNCVFDANASQSDMNGDGEGDRCDLDDGMIYGWAEQSDRVNWHEENGYNSWRAYRGDLELLISSGLYTQLPSGANPLAMRACSLNDSWLDDTDLIPAGKTAFYLITGMNGSVESDLGTDGSGTPRPNDNPCP